MFYTKKSELQKSNNEKLPDVLPTEFPISLLFSPVKRPHIYI